MVGSYWLRLRRATLYRRVELCEALGPFRRSAEYNPALRRIENSHLPRCLECSLSFVVEIEVNERRIDRVITRNRQREQANNDLRREKNEAGAPEGHRPFVQFFYKNLTSSWQYPIRSRLELSMRRLVFGGVLVRC